MESNFVDYVKIYCRSGKGGKGSMHLRHVKYNPNGGPDGGDGGKGGSIILRGNHNYWTLLHLKYERHIFAEHGGNGGRDKCHGTDGKDVYIDVPCGTVVYNAETGKYVCDVTYDGQEVMLLKGGRGGLGNFQFRTATNQAPRYAQPGEPMQEMTIILELKLLADVGLVGFPNAGKSTLVSALSNARPKIANYPFTTMEPSLGIVGYRDGKSFVMADIPGIIEGASEGKGLGLRFLRHIERNSLLLFMVPGDTDDIKREYEILLNELRQFNPEMLDKHRVLAVTKCDLLDEELIEMLRETLPEDLPVVFISAVTGFGLEELKDVLWRELNAESNKLAVITSEDTLVHRDKDMSRFVQELAEEGEDEDIEYIDEEEVEDIEDLDDFEYDEEYEKRMTPELHYYHIAENVTAFSTTRHGGYSQESYGELNVNLYCGDTPEAIAKNRRLLCKALAVAEDRLVMPHQVHDTGISQIGKTFFLLSEDIRKQVLEGIDALITNLKHICIGVSTADCIPIIIYDPEHHAAGVVHSGWRGTVANITGRVVTSMQRAYQSNPEILKAVIGPGISLKNFEVGDEVYEAFSDAGYPMEQISRKEQKWHIDLCACCRLQLEATGIKAENIEESGICTYDEVEDYFSARRLGIASGRILTGIVLK